MLHWEMYEKKMPCSVMISCVAWWLIQNNNNKSNV